MANILRGLNATLGPSSAIYNQATEMGQQLFYSPSVFSYFSPLYRTEKGLLGPEFQIYTTQTAADRADIVHSALYGTLDKSTTVNLTPFVQQAASLEMLLNHVSTVFCGAMKSANLRQAASMTAAAAQKGALAQVQSCTLCGVDVGRSIRSSNEQERRTINPDWSLHRPWGFHLALRPCSAASRARSKAARTTARSRLRVPVRRQLDSN